MRKPQRFTDWVDPSRGHFRFHLLRPYWSGTPPMDPWGFHSAYPVVSRVVSEWYPCSFSFSTKP